MRTPVILVPLDGSERALVALPVAKVLGEVIHATLRIVYVGERALPPAELLERLGLETAQLRGIAVEPRTGEPAEVILQAAAESDTKLIVLCTHTAAAEPGKLMGRTAQAVLRGAPCPVVLVRPERGVAPWSPRRILLPHDGTPATSGALGPAAELARSAGAELTVLHVAAPGAPAPAERGSMTAPRYLDQPQHEWPSWAGEFLERLACICPLQSIRVRMSLASGQPGEEILRVASEQGLDLIVLAWNGEWDRERAATLKAVVRGAPCPAAVVRT